MALHEYKQRNPHTDRVFKAIRDGLVGIDTPCDKCGGTLIGTEDNNGPHGWKVLCLNEQCSRAQKQEFMPMNNKPSRLKPNKRLRRLLDKRISDRCEICRRNDADLPEKLGMHVHHVIPEEIGGPSEEWNLRTYCKSCHELVHVMRRMHERSKV